MTKQPNPYGERAKRMRELTPAFVADLVLYATEDGGREQPAHLGFCCPCFLQKIELKAGVEGYATNPSAYDACPLLGDEPMQPGESRRVGFVTLSSESADVLASSGRFYLWDGRFIGEAHVVNE
jgi:hypothetical protein